ncbi:MAG TPA: hypothetical protein VI318_11265 [Baekduia sp.]
MRIGGFGLRSMALNYRVLYPLRAMERRGHEVVLPDAGGLPSPSELRTCDVVLAYRRWDEPARELLTQLKRRGVAIVWDNDDDCLNAPKSRYNRRHTGGMSNKRIFSEMVKTARSAHAVTVTSSPLAKAYANGGVTGIRVLENCLELGDRPRPTPHPGVTIGWIAGSEHSTELTGLGLVEALGALLDKHPLVRVTSCGVKLPLQERYRHVAAAHFDQLPTLMAGYDIGIAPLKDTLFNRSRSSIKVKEYAASGVPWLASPLDPYAGLGEAQGGRLVRDDEWFASLDALIRDAPARERLARSGRAWAETETTEKLADAYEELFAGAVERASGRPAGTLAMPRRTSAAPSAATRRVVVRLPTRSMTR